MTFTVRGGGSKCRKKSKTARWRLLRVRRNLRDGLFKAAICKYLEHRKNVKVQKANKARASPVIPHGKQTVKQLIGQNQGVSTVESNDPDIKAFDRIARKYGVDYAVKKIKTPDKPKYVIFFKARDSDALKQALTEYADKVTTQKERKPSVLQKLRDYVAVVQSKVLERSKDKQKGQER